MSVIQDLTQSTEALDPQNSENHPLSFVWRQLSHESEYEFLLPWTFSFPVMLETKPVTFSI